MKIKTITLIGLVVFGYSTQAQKIYVKVGANYSKQMPSTTGMQQITEASATNTTYKSVDCQLSTGLSPQLTVGYHLNKNVAFEISSGYHFGVKQVVENQVYNPLGSYTQSTNMTLNYAFINPSFVINGGFEKFSPYIGLGAYVGFSNVLNEEITTNNSDYLRHYTSSGGSQFGFSGKLGMDYNFCSNWSLFAEIFYSNCSWAPEKKHLNKATDNTGTDVYETIKPYEMLTEYKENYKHNSTGMVDANKSQKRLKSSLPLDFFSLGMGVKFSF